MSTSIKLGTPSILVAVAATLTLVGCAAAPRHDAQLDAAREAVATAHRDPQVTGDALIELSKADTALNAADALLLAGKPLADVEYQAYLADRFARAAQEHGKLLASEKAIAELDNRRNAVLLAARERETSRAIAGAASSAQETAMATGRAERAEQELTELQAKHTDRGVVVTLGDVLFATGSSELQEGSQRSISRLTAFLNEHPQRTVRIEGFTDSVGSDAYNQNLSEQRAASVAGALARDGVDRSRIQTRGYGKSYPVASNDSAAGRQQNRRVEVIISDNDQSVPERTR
jgi:outer membrane protein OmpA-like peptidoglycan-associated protein